MSALPPLRLFLDRSTQGDDFIKGIKVLCPDTVPIGEKYGVEAAENVEDITWLAAASAEGRICVGADKRILSAARPLEIAAVLRHQARYLLFANNNLRDGERLRIFRQHLPDLCRLAPVPGPWAYTMTRDSLIPTSRKALEDRLAAAARRLGIDQP